MLEGHTVGEEEGASMGEEEVEVDADVGEEEVDINKDVGGTTVGVLRMNMEQKISIN